MATRLFWFAEEAKGIAEGRLTLLHSGALAAGADPTVVTPWINDIRSDHLFLTKRWCRASRARRETMR
jgi:hypothetical protein